MWKQIWEILDKIEIEYTFSYALPLEVKYSENYFSPFTWKNVRHKYCVIHKIKSKFTYINKLQFLKLYVKARVNISHFRFTSFGLISTQRTAISLFSIIFFLYMSTLFNISTVLQQRSFGHPLAINYKMLYMHCKRILPCLLSEERFAIL